MTEFVKKRFTVPYGGRSATDCEHGWIDPRGKCVMCGEPVVLLVKLETTIDLTRALVDSLERNATLRRK